MAAIKLSYAQLCGNHVLKFFGSDDHDKGLRFSQDKFLMLKAWHASVPTLTIVFNLSSANLSEMHDIDGFGHPAVKEVLSYLAVSGHGWFCTMTLELTPRREAWCIRVLWMRTAASQLATILQPGIQEDVTNCSPIATAGVNYCGRY